MEKEMIQNYAVENSVNVGKFEEEIDLIAGFEKVFVNGTETTIEKGTLALTDIGAYKVVVTDACGNSTEYTFEIEKGANIALIVILIILGLGAAGAGVFFYIKKKNSI